MKKIILLNKILLLSFTGFAQVTVEGRAGIISSGNVSIVLNDMSLVNNGIIGGGAGSFKFTGSQNSSISGTASPSFYMLELAKNNNAKLLLNRQINVGSMISFISGLMDLNNNNVMLDPAAYLANESESSRIVGETGGYIEIIQNLDAPDWVNPGNLGAFIKSTANLGSTTIRRGHTPQSGIGLDKSILRYYNIAPTNNDNLDAALQLKYFDAELNGLTEDGLGVYQYDLSNTTPWTNYHFTGTNSTQNFVEQSGFAKLLLQTLGANGGNINNQSRLTSLKKIVSENKTVTPDIMNKKITIGPNPNYGNFWFTVKGLEKETVSSLYTLDGKLIKQFRTVNMQQQQVNSLGSGIYILKVPGFDAQKIIVQGDSKKGTTNSSTNYKNLN